MENVYLNAYQNNDLIENKENNKNLLNINYSPNILLSSNSSSVNNIINNSNFISNKSSSNKINEQNNIDINTENILTNDKTYSFKPKKQTTPFFCDLKEKKEINNISEFICINKEEKNVDDITFSEILEANILDKDYEKKKYLEEIDKKKKIKNMRDEMNRRCQNLKESIEMNRKKILENIKKTNLEQLKI